ncbi:Villin-4 [Vitis vinifera]|uniref:Villin-4 n=1 Tax=Vitis vinifera TaxID=29760 RepID=A0A438H7W4_VITVI|nr:Villin-4 [Vitis vinifera]
MFRSKFDMWPETTAVTVSEDGRGKVAGLLKAAPVKEEPQPYIDCTGNLQVWRVNGQEKTLLSASDQSKFYSGDCYIFSIHILEKIKRKPYWHMVWEAECRGDKYFQHFILLLLIRSGNPIGLERTLCGKKAQDSLESESPLHFLDSLEDN